MSGRDVPTMCLLACSHLQRAHTVPVSIAFKWTYYVHVFGKTKSAYTANVLHL